MIPAAMDYVRADSAEAAVAALAEHGEEAKLLAGGQSLIPLMRLRLATPAVLVDVGRASDLVKTSKHLKPLAEYLLGNLAVVEELRKAMDSKELAGWGLVDKDGTYSGSDMILKNRQTTEHGSLIGRRKKLDTISLEIDGFQDKEINLFNALYVNARFKGSSYSFLACSKGNGLKIPNCVGCHKSK